MINHLCKALSQREIEYKTDLPLSEYSTFRIGGRGEIGIFPNSREQLAQTVGMLAELEMPYKIIGNGSNILFADGNIKGALIFTKKMKTLRLEGNMIIAEAGVPLSAVASLALQQGLCGFEFAAGIPGTVGGGIYMNAGAYGGALSDVLKTSVALNTESGEQTELTEHSFGYRKSIYISTPTLVCVEGTLQLAEGNKEEIKEKMHTLAENRRQKQPLSLPSAGSYFKRPEGSFAGKLIEDAGLKGFQIGGARVSEKHAGFIVNTGGATAAEVLAVESHIKNTVFALYGVMLEREVRVIE